MDILNKEEAWVDFMENVKPLVWSNLTKKEKNTIEQAQKDASNYRKDIRGNPVNLGLVRVKRILEKYAPERYEIQIRFECRVK